MGRGWCRSALLHGSAVFLGAVLLSFGTEAANACPPGMRVGAENDGRGMSWRCVPDRRHQGGGGGVISGGGSNRAAAAIGAAGVVLGVLGSMMHNHQTEQATREAERHEAQRRAIAARQAYCRNNWLQATAANQRANDTFNRWDPGGAIPLYERAIALLRRCSDSRNIAIVHRNLDTARRQYAAIRPDNRVDDAIRRFGSNVSQPNPFASGSTPADREIAPQIEPHYVFKTASERCDYVTRGEAEWTNCMMRGMARVIMEAELEVRAACDLHRDLDARRECAVRRYAASLDNCQAAFAALRAAVVLRDPCPSNDPFSATGEANIYEVGIPRPEPRTSDSLREELRERLRRTDDATRTSPGPCTVVGNHCIPNEDLAGQGQPAQAPQPQGPIARTDDPLQDYLNSRNSRGGFNSGDLGTGRGTNVGMPDRGSFANDFGGDQLLGESVPSRR